MSLIEKYFQIADIVLKVIGRDGELFTQSRMLRPFEVEKMPYQRELVFQMEEELPKPSGVCELVSPGRRICSGPDAVEIYIGQVSQSEQDGYMCLHRQAQRTSVVVRRSEVPGFIGEKVVLRAMELEHILAEQEGLILHASCISHDGAAVLFTAPSGVGKSTQAGLWEAHRGAKVINGDRIIIRKEGDTFKAWGVPFSGTSGICHQACLPIRAIVYLRQAPKTSIRPLTGIKALRSIWEGCSVYRWNQPDVEQSFATVTSLISQVPVYELCCTPDEEAVRALENAMKGRVNDE